MVKNTQAIFRQEPTNCFSVFDYFVELLLKELASIATSKSFKQCRIVLITSILLHDRWFLTIIFDKLLFIRKLLYQI